ncbi:MAG: hypothetical protein CVV14_03370 [Gammaproteobacteria bacterium HGW-Gammaproteobacteria-4]|nr:MAG: hypothetical protein CVV14_03370 [Gammaproteobacteria bacterium HGW-Gammaproteobacteria-4]
MHQLFRSLSLLAILAGGSAKAVPPVDPLLAATPVAAKAAVTTALRAMRCAVGGGVPAPDRLAVIDYSKPSTENRLWVFDLAANSLLYEERVAHGRNSGENLAANFSNESGSYASSLGLFRTGDTYVGRNGYSLRMQGLEPGFNDNAMSRAIVIHGADYVSDAFVRKVGRIGRSLGCPAVRRKVAHALIDTIQNGQFVFSYYPDPQWLARSQFVNCDGGAMARHDGIATAP